MEDIDGVLLPHEVTLQPFLQLQRLMHANTRPIPKIVVRISHRIMGKWIQVETRQHGSVSYPLMPRY